MRSSAIVVVFVMAALADGASGEQHMSNSQPAGPAARVAAGKDMVEYSTLVVARDVTRRLASAADSRKAARQFLAAGFERIWIETVRGGHRADLDVVRRARDIFREEGLIVGGAITITWGEGFGQRSSQAHSMSLCYSAPQTQQVLAATATDACRLFDEVMYDDFMFTDCRCERCTREKGDRSWAEYRCELKSRVARDFIVRPGHAANPHAIIIVKYPQWYDKLHVLGYDVIRDTAHFDAIWIGTEIRNRDTPEYGFVPTSDRGKGVYRFGWIAREGQD